MQKIVSGTPATLTVSQASALFREGKVVAYKTARDFAILTRLNNPRHCSNSESCVPRTTLWGFVYYHERRAGAKYISESPVASMEAFLGHGNELGLYDTIQDLVGGVNPDHVRDLAARLQSACVMLADIEGIAGDPKLSPISTCRLLDDILNAAAGHSRKTVTEILTK